MLQRAGYRHRLRANTSPKAIELVNRALASERLSLRGADRAMRLAWTLSDLAGKTSPDLRK